MASPEGATPRSSTPQPGTPQPGTPTTRVPERSTSMPSDAVAGSTPERTVGQLVHDATQDLSETVHNLVELAKAELSADAAKAGKGAGMLGAAGVLALFAVSMLLFAAAFGLIAAGVWAWLSFLIVGVVVLIVVGILALIGRGALKKIHGKPERTIQNAKETLAAITSKS